MEIFTFRDDTADVVIDRMTDDGCAAAIRFTHRVLPQHTKMAGAVTPAISFSASRLTRVAIHIPPNAVHSLRPTSDHAAIHCFCFAVGEPGAGEVNYTEH